MKDWEDWAWDVLVGALMFAVGFNVLLWMATDMIKLFEW